MTALGRPLPEAVLWLGAAAASAATGLALALAGPVAAAAPVVLLAVVLLASRPALLLSLFLVVVVALESDAEGFLPARAAFFKGVPSPSDVLFTLLIVAVVADRARRSAPLLLPRPFTLPLALLSVAIAIGVFNGILSGAPREAVIAPLQALVPLIVLPVLVVNVAWESSRDRLVVGAAAVLAVLKGGEGIVSWLLDAGRPVGETTLTFYAPATNFLLMLFVLGVVGALAARLRLPRWALLATPLCVAAFVLSYRRSFWIAAVLGVAAVLVLGSGFRARRAAVVLLVVFLVSVRAITAVTGAPELDRSLSERLRSLAPARVTADPYDRYRLDEAKNVLAEVRSQPFTGLGLGVPWVARHPLPAELEGGRDYTHVVALWYWLKLGVLGLAAYLALMVAALVAAVRVSRSHGDPYVRVAALAVGAALVALASAEATASFTGVSYRLTVELAAILGWLAVMTSRADAR